MRLTRVTITGADDGVERSELQRLSEEFPFVEWAILLSKKRQGMPRYPSSDWIVTFVGNAYRHLHIAGHLCGEWARDAHDGPFLWAITNHGTFERLERLQVNVSAMTRNMMDKIAYIGRETGKEFIVQLGSVFDFTVFECPRTISYLIDDSGGRGILLQDFTAPPGGYRVGYAGGINPENVESVLTRLCSLSGESEFWIDCESGVRDDKDWFDLDKVRSLLAKAKGFVK